MSRITEKSVPGVYTIKYQGSLIGTYSTQKSYEYLVRSDPTPGARDGEWLHPTDYSASKTEHYGPFGTYTRPTTHLYEGELYNVSSGSNQAVGWQAPSYRPHLLARAIIDARQKLSSDGFNLLQNIAERQQAIDLVKDRLISIWKSYRALREGLSAYKKGAMNERRWKFLRRKIKEAFRHLGLHNKSVARRMSENILAWNYGVAPLADDVDKAVQMFSNPKTLHPLIGVTGKAKEGDMGEYRIVEEKNTGFMPRTLRYAELCSARCVLFVNPDNVDQIRAAALQVNNPFLLGWELIPYSFIVDWALDIGGWLDSIGSTAGWKFYSGYTMERTKCKTFFAGLQDKYGKSVIDGFRTCFRFQRRRLTAFPTPGWPGFKNPFTLVHCLNAVALFGARLK